MATTEERLAALEQHNKNLEAEVNRLRPKAPPVRREPSGRDFGQGDRSMAELAAGRSGVNYDQPLVGSSTGPGILFDTYRVINGVRTYAPDGVARDPATGEALQTRPADPLAGPTRTAQHELAVRIIDSALPIVRPVFEK